MRKVSASLLVVLCSLLFLSAFDKTAAILPTAGDFAPAIRANDLTALRCYIYSAPMEVGHKRRILTPTPTRLD